LDRSDTYSTRHGITPDVDPQYLQALIIAIRHHSIVPLNPASAPVALALKNELQQQRLEVGP
jgi:hypothetical protein